MSNNFIIKFNENFLVIRPPNFQGYKTPSLTDPNQRRMTTRDPIAPATKGLRTLMEKLGGINTRHEGLVKRVDEIEVQLTQTF
jgi:hypothetical protein